MNPLAPLMALGAVFLFFGVFVFGLLALWIWMLVDCLTNPRLKGTDQVVWVLVIIFLNWLGALIYLLVERPKKKQALPPLPPPVFPDPGHEYWRHVQARLDQARGQGPTA